MTELEKEEFNRLKESCLKSIERIKQYLNDENTDLSQVDTCAEELSELLNIWEY